MPRLHALHRSRGLGSRRIGPSQRQHRGDRHLWWREPLGRDVLFLRQHPDLNREEPADRGMSGGRRFLGERHDPRRRSQSPAHASRKSSTTSS